MSLSVLEVLENAEFNLKSKVPVQRDIGLDQLSNAIKLLDMGVEAEEDANLDLLKGDTK